jgi:cytochrome c
MDDRFNTIAGWVLFAGIVALGSSIVAGEVFHSERPEEMGYPIEGVEVEGEGGADAEKPIAFYLASADASKGQQVFNKCTACHTVDKGGPAQLGPNLWGIMGAPIGKRPGFAFSPALSGKGGNWDWESMSAWLKSPKAFANGTKMTFAGLGKPEDRANVMAFLNSKSDSPLPVPAAPAASGDAVQDNSGAKAGTGPGNGPQKAESEPVLTEQQAAKSKMNLDGEGASKTTGPESVRTKEPR